MPLDAVCLQAVVAELSPLVAGSRIEKIQQPARDQVVLLLRGSRRLLLSAGGGQPRGTIPPSPPCSVCFCESICQAELLKKLNKYRWNVW